MLWYSQGLSTARAGRQAAKASPRTATLNILVRRRTRLYFPLFIANGVTSVREMWTKLENMPQVREWRRLQLDGSLIAPRIAAVGTLVDGPAGVETTNLPALQPGPTANSVSTPEEARQFVREVKAAGIDFAK